MNKAIFAIIALLALFACARPPVTVTKPEESMTHLSWWQGISPRDDSEFKDIARAAHQSLEYYKRLPPDTSYFFGPDKATALDMLVTLQDFLSIVENDALNYGQKVERIRKEFIFYRSVGSDSKGTVLFTGYYEPLLSCRMAPDDVFRFPLYRKPADIIEVDLNQFGAGFPRNKLFGRLDGKRVIPYYSREEIDQKRILAGN